MTCLLKKSILASDLANSLGLDLAGDDCEIKAVASLRDFRDHVLYYTNKTVESLQKFAVIAPSGLDFGDRAHLRSTNPRLDFARSLLSIAESRQFVGYESPPIIHETASIAPSAHIGLGCTIGAFTRIEHNVVISDGVQIGKHCHIRSNAVIGEKGFGFERNEEGIPITFLHLGTVIIGDHVEVGNATSICCGTLDDTIIEDYVKIDNLVHISHNCIIRKGSLIIACAEISGSVEIGAFSWVGPNSSIIEQRKLGEWSLVGIASNVLKDVDARAIVVGNPAKPIPQKS
jgi:acyl-[acyl carrier protein]--UDP-N-acetylglucosamine O-acyltransferase